MKKASMEEGYELESMTIHTADMYKFYDKCNELGIPYALDWQSEFKESNISHGINIVILKETEPVVHQILCEIDKESLRTYENRHDVTPKQKTKALEEQSKPQKKSIFGF